jgi:hypothetical protein
MIPETVDLRCYGSDIEALADLGGDFDALSATSTAAWDLGQWTQVADILGFRRELDADVETLRRARVGIVDVHTVARTAFARARRSAARPTPDALPAVVRVHRARVRHDVLTGIATGELWRRQRWHIDAPATALAHNACFDRKDAAVSGRAFLVDTSENYFHGPRREPPGPGGCGWEGPVLLSLGTFPWVHGGRLARAAPGLRWDASGPWDPAAVAMALCARFWQPLGNLDQDARTVVAHYRRLSAGVDFALGEALSPGVVRRGLLLDAPASHDIAGLHSGLGYLNVTAHNYIVRRFAGFFATRRALLRVATRLPAELQATIAGNPDPCLKRPEPRPLVAQVAP